ncbi:MAG: hypothetical protein LBH44_04145 [Treponema sp.]|jgi:hypothetical protein|nr:hypothetical protein [Treponema sp.]
MTPEKLSALLSILNPPVIQMIIDNRRVNSIEAARLFYNSDLYAMLEKEESKLWHLSPLTLYELFEEELATGSINYPEEA